MSGRQLSEGDLRQLYGSAAVEHSRRFRRVSNRYPNVVALAYDRDLAAAALASDAEVAERVRAWELAEGVEPRDWPAIGRAEREDDER